MGGKSSPPPPDYTGAAREQAAASKEVTNIQNYANRPVINTPFGSQSWQTQAITDPATGQEVTQWTQNTSLAPQLQNALDSQMAVQQGRSDLAQGFMQNVANSYQNPFDWQNLPDRVMPNAPTQLQGNIADYSQGLQSGLNTQGLRDIPQYDMSARNQIADSLMERMQPTHDRQMQGLSAQLANQGFQVGSEAYNRALGDLLGAQSKERFNALDQAGNEAQRMYSMGLGARQQGFNEALQGGNFYNQALNQAGNMDINRMNAMNQAAGQAFNFGNQYADQMARMRQQGIAEQQLQRAIPLNEMNALLTGQQVGMPQMPSFNTAQRSETPQLMEAANLGYQAQLDASNAKNAAFGNLLGAGAQLGSAFMFSDRRLKSDIRRVGTHAIGVGVYEYTIAGMPQTGVIAQEVQAVRPDLVERHANGYLMVNYNALGA